MTPFGADSHGIIYRHTAIDQGYTDKQLARAVDDDTLARIWPGAYVPTLTRTPEELHKLTAIAAVTLSPGDFALSHHTAGTMHDLSMLDPDLERVHISTGYTTGARLESRRHIHSGTLDDADLTVIDGIPVTSIERTAADIACSGGFAPALAVMDSALRRGADRDVIGEYLDGHKRGVAQARRALAHADAGSENAGESWGRAQIICAGLPIPRLQHEFRDARGTLIARTDYDWIGKLVAEFDGMAKYQKHLRPGETPFDVMRREKEREDALRRLGIMVIRWVWEDLRRNRVVPMVREWLERLGIAA
ncbi:hypothetical protein QSJ19_06035 [Gordonia sp. ABSL11-1]|uniref:hypothetical protein n=1 Tax=Gordonia sp. ABSL11-1 TaxID=3053924 RepID=UPI0025739DA2|nr:hypothetical protein [Gordonia sp. ABSL11-1]MDL9945155.1 hypothetical protein [Gordonia sp. ABSL11-1]